MRQQDWPPIKARKGPVRALGISSPDLFVQQPANIPPTLAPLYYFIVLHQLSGVIVHVGWTGVVVRNNCNQNI